MKRRFQYKDKKSDKFWEIELKGKSYTTWYGKTGGKARSDKNTYKTEEEAKKEYEKIIERKMKKGYKEVEKKEKRNDTFPGDNHVQFDFFEYAPTNTFVRIISSQLQIIRENKEIAKFQIFEKPVSFSRNGFVLFHYRGEGLLLDLNKDFPQKPKVVPYGTIHPDGTKIFKFATKEKPFKEKYIGLFSIDIKSGKIDVIWNEDISKPEKVSLGKTEDLEEVSMNLDNCDVLIGKDGETWALVSSHRLEVGKGNKRAASIYWEDGLFERKYNLDLDKKRLVVSDEYKGLVAFSLKGKVLLNRKSEEYILVSPVTKWKKEYVVVVKDLEFGKSKPFYVMKFDYETLKPIGELNEFTKMGFGDGDCSSALLLLYDGSLVLIPGSESDSIMILPALGSNRRTEGIIKIVGEPVVDVIPHPKEKWYDKEIGESGKTKEIIGTTEQERKSLARFILNDNFKDNRFSKLIEFDVNSFTPYLEKILSLEDSNLLKLNDADPTNYWKIVKGASDKEVNKLFKKIKDDLPKVNRARVELLIGVDTEKSLNYISKLARLNQTDINKVLGDFPIFIPKMGSAERRFSSESIVIVGKSKGKNTQGIEFPLEQKDFIEGDERGLQCNMPLKHILTIKKRLIPGNLLNKSQFNYIHWFISGCQSCDEWLTEMYEYEIAGKSDKKIRLLNSSKKITCKGDVYKSLVKSRKFIVEKSGFEKNVVCKLGGYPSWWQAAEIPYCSKCKKMMFYVGQAFTSNARDDVPDAALYAFVCEDCNVGVQIEQIT